MTGTKTSWEKVLVHTTGNCKKVFIPGEYCTIYLQSTMEGDCEVHQVGADTCIEVLDTKKFKCMQEGLDGKGDKWVKVKK